MVTVKNHSRKEKVSLMKRIWIAAIGLVCLAWPALAGAQEKPAPQKPNIILILSDNVGLGDIGCCGGAFKTPQIDSLAKGGTRFGPAIRRRSVGPRAANS